MLSLCCLEPKAAESSECPVLIKPHETTMNLFFLLIDYSMEGMIMCMCGFISVAAVDS